jgi:hypothetical protein
LEQAKLRRRSGETISQAHHARVVHARELIREFPGEPEGYGLLLALAKTGEPAIARHLAGELLASPAPENFKAGAQRVLGRLELLGRRLRFAEADAAITGARGKPLIVYSWTAADEGFLRIIRQHAKASDVALVGVNLDVDIDSAKAVATTLPGTQYFDGAGLDGPRARQLCLLFRTSLYLVDEHGIVREVDGQNHPEALFAGIAARKRGAR